MENLKNCQKISKKPLIKVIWSDSVQDISGWIEEESYDFDLHEESMRMETTGYCIKSTDNAIFVAQSIGNDKVASVISIPSGCIKSITVLRRD